MTQALLRTSRFELRPLSDDHGQAARRTLAPHSASWQQTTPGPGCWAGISKDGAFVGRWAPTPAQTVAGPCKRGRTGAAAAWFLRIEPARGYTETMSVNAASRGYHGGVPSPPPRGVLPPVRRSHPGAEEGEVEYWLSQQEWLASTAARRSSSYYVTFHVILGIVSERNNR